MKYKALTAQSAQQIYDFDFVFSETVLRNSYF